MIGRFDLFDSTQGKEQGTQPQVQPCALAPSKMVHSNNVNIIKIISILTLSVALVSFANYKVFSETKKISERKVNKWNAGKKVKRRLEDALKLQGPSRKYIS